MRLDELTRELNAQAEHAAATSPVRLEELRARRLRQDRRRTAAGAFAALAAGSVLLAGPWWHDGSGSPGPSEAPSIAPTADRSPAPTDGPAVCNRGCSLPANVSHAGQRYEDRSGGLQPLFAPNGLNRELSLSVDTRHGARVVLVGALRAGSQARLVVSVGSGPSRRLTGGGLWKVVVPGAAQPEEVVVRETGRPARREVLRIEEYVRAR